MPNSIAYDQSLSKQDNKNRGNLEPLNGIENGTQKLNDSFANIGIAPIRVKNPRKADLIKIIDVFLSATTPKSSKLCFFFYVTGHGARLVFFTRDGSISYDDVYSKVSGSKSSFFDIFEYRFFMFDCCRSCRLDDLSFFPNKDGIMPSEPNIRRKGDCMLFATTDGTQAFGPGQGVSFMTCKLCDLLTEKISLKDMIIELGRDLEQKGQTPECRTAAGVDIHLSVAMDIKS